MSPHAGAVLVGAIEGRAPTAAEKSVFARIVPAGVTLFARNVPPDDFRRLKELNDALQVQRPSGAPRLVIAIDQEGGRVSRIRLPGFPDGGPAQKLAEGRSDERALRDVRAHARDVGTTLRAIGVNVNFAPCADVLTEPTNIAIGDRVFGVEPDAVVARAGAYLDGLQETGVLGCLKHFPGQGDAKVDTHAGQAIVDVPYDTLFRRELVPFVRLLPRAPMVMVAHCIYPALAPVEASRSDRIMRSLLRGEMGYEGVVVTDDMMMGAIPQDDTPWRQAIVAAVAAGADMVLVCRHAERMVAAAEALSAEAAKSRAFSARLEDAARRVTGLRGRLVGADRGLS